MIPIERVVRFRAYIISRRLKPPANLREREHALVLERTNKFPAKARTISAFIPYVTGIKITGPILNKPCVFIAKKKSLPILWKFVRIGRTRNGCTKRPTERQTRAQNSNYVWNFRKNESERKRRKKIRGGRKRGKHIVPVPRTTCTYNRS